MNNITVFENQEFGCVRTVDVNGEVWFVAKDIADILGYSDTAYAIRTYCKGVEKIQLPSNGGAQETNIVAERDLYRLILRSSKKEAEKFEEWVVGEVLPSIRKTGGYLAPTVDFSNPENLMKLLTNWAEDRKKLEIANTQIEEDKPKVEFHDAVIGSDDTVDMAQVAKLLNMGIGRNRLFQLLRDKHILMNNNSPYQYYVDNGWFRLVESRFTKPNGDTCINIKTVVFQKGIKGIKKIVEKEQDGR